jgi:site-specific DNA-methyltransferase (adenine-specific)
MTTPNGLVHPAAELFPMLDVHELKELADDIRQHGLNNPIVLLSDGTLLDGRNRLAACSSIGLTPRFETFKGADPVAYVMSENLQRRHLTVGQRAMLALEVEPLYAAQRPQGRHTHHVADLPHDDAKKVRPREPLARDKAAKVTGTSGRAVAQAKRVATAEPELAMKVKTGELALDRADRIVRDRERQAKRDAETQEREHLIRLGTNVDIRLGDFREVLSDVSEIDAIITDPPYPAEFLPLLDDLAAFATRSLKPNGLMAVMIGQSYLPEVYQRLNGQLPYVWTMAYLTPGGQAVQIWDRKVNTFWKPILIYGHTAEWIGDVCKSDTNNNDKRHHEWGQSISGMVDLVKRLTKPGQIIVDPFAGAGTTGLAALTNGCHFIGSDIDQKSVHIARDRCSRWAA